MFKRILSFFSRKESQTSQKRITGKIKYFNRKRGFGFIRSREVEGDIFVHINDTEVDVRKGKKVAFTLEENEKGYVAREVRKA